MFSKHCPLMPVEKLMKTQNKTKGQWGVGVEKKERLWNWVFTKNNLFFFFKRAECILEYVREPQLISKEHSKMLPLLCLLNWEDITTERDFIIHSAMATCTILSRSCASSPVNKKHKGETWKVWLHQHLTFTKHHTWEITYFMRNFITHSIFIPSPWNFTPLSTKDHWTCSQKNGMFSLINKNYINNKVVQYLLQYITGVSTPVLQSVKLTCHMLWMRAHPYRWRKSCV